MNDTQQIDNPTPESRFKQFIAFAQIVAEQQIQERIGRLESLSRGRLVRSPDDQSEFDKLIVEIKTLHFKIALLNLIAEGVI